MKDTTFIGKIIMKNTNIMKDTTIIEGNIDERHHYYSRE